MDAITYALSKKYTDNKIAESSGLHREIVNSLPSTGDNSTIYMVLDPNASSPDVYDEWLWINGTYEHIGSTRVDLSDYYNKTQIDAALSGKANTSDIPTTLSDLSDDLTHRLVTDAEKTAWDGKSNFSGSYNDLTNKPTIPSALSDLTDDSTHRIVTDTEKSTWNGKANTATSLSGYGITDAYTKTEVDTALSGKADVSAIPTKLSDLSDDTTHRTVTDTEKSTWSGKADISDIPTKLSNFTNDSGFVTSTVNNLTNYYLKSETYTKAEVDALIQAITTLDIQAVSTLPTTNISTTTIYLVPKQNAQSPDVKDEYINLDGTTTGWELIGNTQIDLSNYVTTSDLNTALSTKQDSLTFDNVPTQNSNNPVKSGGVFSSVDDIYSVMGQNGAKNLIPYPYYRASGYSVNGMTTTYDGDGVLTINKVAGTAAAHFKVANLNFLKPNTKYRLVFEVANATSINIYVQKPVSGDYVTITDKSSGIFEAEFETTAESQITERSIAIWCSASDTETNATVKAMIVLASDTDNTYQPYAKTNKQLTDDKAEVVSVRDYINELGVKNLLVPKWTETQTTENGVTYTFNADGTIIMNTDENGATANTNCNLRQNTVTTNNVFPAGTYTLTACPAGGSSTTYRTWARAYRAGTTTALTSNLYDEGNGVSFTVSEPFSLGLNVTVMKDYVCNNLTWKPMLRLASDINDDTYVPYAMTNKQLTEKKANISDVPTALSQLTADATHRLVTDTEKSNWNGKCQGGNTSYANTSITSQMDALKAAGKSGVFPFYISSGNADFSTTGYCMAIGAIHNGGVSTITAVNSQTGDIWTNANTSQVAGDWRGWRKIDAVVDLGSISATSNNDAVGKAWDAIAVYEKPVIVQWFYSGSFMALMYKYNGSQYGMAMAMKYNTTDVYTLSVNNGTKTYGNVGSNPVKTQSLTIDIPAVSAGRGCVEYKALPTVSGYKAIGIVEISPIGDAGTLSLNSFLVNNTSAYISYENNKSSATAASSVTLTILYIKT